MHLGEHSCLHAGQTLVLTPQIRFYAHRKASKCAHPNLSKVLARASTKGQRISLGQETQWTTILTPKQLNAKEIAVALEPHGE